MNGNYTKLEDINMSFKLWNNSYYHVRFKNIEDIKNKKEECLKNQRNMDIFLISFLHYSWD